MLRTAYIGGFFVILLLTISIAMSQEAMKYETAVIYYNDPCSMCSMYIAQELRPMLENEGLQIIAKDYINNKEYRKDLNELNNQLGIPMELQGHFTTFIDNKIILEGHIPDHVIKDILEEENLKIERIVILQDEMTDAETYKVWAFKGEIKEYPIDTPISEYLNWFLENEDTLVTPPDLLNMSLEFTSLLPFVLLTGLLDGLNPCAFAVILFLIAFLFTLRKTRASVFKMGVAYILAIYVVYFLIGLGILQVIHIFNVHHFMAKFGSYLIITLGLINLAGYFFPKFPIKLGIPGASKGTIKKWVHKATIPAALILGALVGLCVFPCSGAVYVAIIGFLTTKATYVQAVSYLLLYNLMFVMPLIMILILASNKKVVGKMTKWERSKSGMLHLISGLVMVILGLVILIWFV